jgi:hypothetical protein
MRRDYDQEWELLQVYELRVDLGMLVTQTADSPLINANER